jgi:hypothetical protein
MVCYRATSWHMRAETCRRCGVRRKGASRHQANPHMRSLIAHSRSDSAVSCEAALLGLRLQSAKYSPLSAGTASEVARNVWVAAPCARLCHCAGGRGGEDNFGISYSVIYVC